MSTAVVGLVGVVVGGLLSGGTIFLMARRAEAARLRTAARLLEFELRTVAEQLDELPRGPLKWWSSDQVLARKVLSLPQPRLWEEHQASLAATMRSQDWYALVAVYESIAKLRRIAANDAAFTDTGKFSDDMVRAQAQELVETVQSGARAIADLAGSYAGRPTVDRTYTLRINRQQAGRWSVSESADRDPPSHAA